MTRKTTVLVDAENVRRSKWPNVAAAELVELCSVWAAENGVEAVVVFDGKTPDGRTAEHRVADSCTVVGTGAESADDWLTREAARYEPYWLVTSDRELRVRAGDAAAKIIGGGAFARMLAP